jgi:hypothetical protein
MAIIINSFTPNTNGISYGIVGSNLSYSVDATETGGLTLQYQWQRKISGTGSFSNISGATASTYTTPTLSLSNTGDFYRVIVTTSSPFQQVIAPSNDGVELRVVDAPSLNVIGSFDPEYIVEAGDTLSLPVQVTYTNDAAGQKELIDRIQFQWQESIDDGITWSNIILDPDTTVINATFQDVENNFFYRQSNLLFQNISTSKNLKRYRVIISSNEATNSPLAFGNTLIIVSPRIVITTQPVASLEVFRGSDFSLSVDAISTIGNRATISYQWWFASKTSAAREIVEGDNTGFFTAIGSTTKNLLIKFVDFIEDLSFFVVINAFPSHPQAVSNTTNVTVQQYIVVGRELEDTFSLEDRYGNIPNRESFVDPIRSATFNLVVLDDDTGYGSAATTGDLIVKWQRQDPGSNQWYYLNEIDTLTSSSYTTPPLRISTDDGARYRAEISAINAINSPYYSPQLGGISSLSAQSKELVYIEKTIDDVIAPEVSHSIITNSDIEAIIEELPYDFSEDHESWDFYDKNDFYYSMQVGGGLSDVPGSDNVTGPEDASVWRVDLPFTIEYCGVAYDDWIEVTTNSWISFSEIRPIIPAFPTPSSPPTPKISLYAFDRSADKLYYKTVGVSPNREFRLVFSGYRNPIITTNDNDTIKWEIVFYENEPSKFSINTIPYKTHADLDVYRQIFFSIQPNNVNAIIGQTASFSVAVETSSPSTIIYQWQYSTNFDSRNPQNATWQNVVNDSIYSGANTNLLLINSVTQSLNNTYYRNIANTDNTLSSITSSEVVIKTVPDSFTSISQINDLFLKEGELLLYEITAQSLSLSAITYQWQKSVNYNPLNPNAATWDDISGANSNIYTKISVSADDAAYYRCKLTSTGGVISFTNVAKVTVTPLTITVTSNYPSNISILENQSPSYQFEISASPSISASVFYRWQYSTDGGNVWVNYSLLGGYQDTPSTSDTFIPPAFSRDVDGIKIRCALTSDVIPGTFYSNVATIFVDRRVNYFASPSIINVPLGQQATIDASAFSTGGFVTYQWQISNNGTTWSDLPGEENEQIIILSPVNNTFYRCIITVPNSTSYQYFTSASGLQTFTISPPGSPIITVSSRILITAKSFIAIYYSNETMKTGAAIGTVVCFPKPRTYVGSGFVGEDYNRWYVANSKGYSDKYVGYLPLTGPSVNWNAAHYPELVRLLGTKYGGSVSGNYPNYTGTFKMPPVTGKILMGTGNVDNNRSSASVIPFYQGNGQPGGSINEVGSIGGYYNYRKSEQLPPGSPGTAGLPDGTAGASSTTPGTFTLGTFSTTGWTDTETTIKNVYTETVSWSVGPLGEISFGAPTLHSHGMSGWGVDINFLGASGGGGSTSNCNYVESDFGNWLVGPALLGGSNSALSHVHGLNRGDASAEGQGHGTGRGGVGSDSISGSFTHSLSGSSLEDGTLNMSNQSNSLWNSVLSFYLRNNEALPVNYSYFRLRYFIKAW